MQHMDYATLSLADVTHGLEAVAREARATFGGLDARQLNWRPTAAQWSIAQCFDHLLTANRLMFQAAEDAMDHGAPRTVWQRLPVLPRVLGRALIRSQAPTATRKFVAPPRARPASSDIAAGIIQAFVEQHEGAVTRLRALDERHVARVIMVSPFIKVVTYSVLDGCRLVFAHDRRHVEQARGVSLSTGFPKAV
jgi:hypothetical protein